MSSTSGLVLPDGSRVQQQDGPRRGCRQRAFDVLSVGFDLLTVTVSLVDVVSDFLVAMQFLSDGHDAWAWVIFGIFINSNFVYTYLIVQFGIKRVDSHEMFRLHRCLPDCFLKLPAPLQFVVLFPFAQLAPLVNFLLQRCVFDDLSADSEPWGGSAPPQLQTGIAEGTEEEMVAARDAIVAAELQAAEATLETIARVDGNLENTLRSHGFFIAETLVEAIPQAVVQVLAISVLGNPSVLQILSMVLSVVSLLSKVYLFCSSCSTRVFVLKYLLAAFDVFTLFYICASIVSRDGPQDVEVISGVWVSHLTVAWLVKQMTFLAYFGSILFLAIGIHVWGHCKGHQPVDAKKICQLLWEAVLYLVVSLPVLLATEAVKLSWFTRVVYLLEPQRRNRHVMSIYYSFVAGEATSESVKLKSKRDGEEHGDSDPYVVTDLDAEVTLSADLPGAVPASLWQSRVAYLHAVMYEFILMNATLNSPMKNDYRRPMDLSRMLAPTARLHMDLDGRLYKQFADRPRWKYVDFHEKVATAADFTDDPMRFVKPGDLEQPLDRQEFYADRENAAIVADWEQAHVLLDEALENGVISQTEYTARCHNFLVGHIYAPSRLRRLAVRWLMQMKFFSDADPIDKAKRNVVFVLWGILWIGALLSVIYVPVNLGMSFSSQNTVQYVCASLASVTLPGIVMLLPSGVRYFRFFVDMYPVREFADALDVNADVALDGIRRYHLPPVDTLVASHIPNGLIPADVVGEAVGFLYPSMIDLSTVTIADCYC